jgi:hypothetical protein
VQRRRDQTFGPAPSGHLCAPVMEEGRPHPPSPTIAAVTQ